MGRQTRQEVYEAIDSERDYQDSLWGNTLSGNRAPKDDQQGGDRSLDEFAMYLGGYANDLEHAASHYVANEEKKDIIRKIAALAVSAMEQHGAPHRVIPDQASLDKRRQQTS
jgi:hypothetical protein